MYWNTYMISHLGFNKMINTVYMYVYSLEQSCQPVTFKKSIIEIKKTYFEVKKSIFARGARITSAKSFRPGSRDLRALEAHGF